MNRETDTDTNVDIDDSSENVLSEWPRTDDERDGETALASQPAVEEEVEPEVEEEDEAFEVELEEDEGAGISVAPSLEHAAGDLDIPEGYAVLEGVPDGGRRAVGIVVAR